MPPVRPRTRCRSGTLPPPTSRSFDIISQIEDAEIGFSPEEGQFESIPEDLIGRPWPMCFGTCVHVEGVPLNEPATGTLATGVGIIDFLLPHRMFAINRILAYINEQIGDWLDANGFWSVSEAASSGDEELKKQLEGFMANKARFEQQNSEVLNVLDDQAKTIVASFGTGDGWSILRHNVRKYGTKEREFDFYIYNKLDMVLKSATFWLIRYSNTWKKVRFSTPLTKLNLETFDAVTLDFDSPYVANSDVLALVEKADYDFA